MTNFSEKIAISINDRNVIAFLVDAKGTVSNATTDLVGYKSGAAGARGEITYPADGTSEIYQIASTSVNDTLLGTGARKVEVTYLDEVGAFQQIIKDLDGQTPVDLPAAFRILGANVQNGDSILTPSSAKTAGDVSIGQNFTTGVPTNVYMQISPETGQCNSGVVTVPVNHRGVFQAAFASGPKTDEVEFVAFSRATGEQWSSPAGFFSADHNDVTDFIVNAFDSLQDIELRAISTSGPSEVRVLFNIIFIPVAAA